MATLKRTRPYRSRARLADVPSVAPLSLCVILDGPRPGPGNPAADALWLELRQQVSRACVQHPKFDPRRLLDDRSDVDRRILEDQRRPWLASKFADDPRVSTA
jgi:hypothetical protein